MVLIAVVDIFLVVKQEFFTVTWRRRSSLLMSAINIIYRSTRISFIIKRMVQKSEVVKNY